MGWCHVEIQIKHYILFIFSQTMHFSGTIASFFVPFDSPFLNSRLNNSISLHSLCICSSHIANSIFSHVFLDIYLYFPYLILVKYRLFSRILPKHLYIVNVNIKMSIFYISMVTLTYISYLQLPKVKYLICISCNQIYSLRYITLDI